jgi:serine/threonine-protein kinase
VLTPADVLNERYRLDAPIASGGMGEVWRATDISLGRTVALKVMRAERHPGNGFDARFRAEARTMAALRHPNVVNVYDYGQSPLADGTNVSYLVMNYVDGESLRDRLAAAGRLPVGATMALLAQAADALHAVHQHGIIHRDVKPANLLVQPDDTIVLVDFGVARSAALTSVTTADAILGTALYMAPEQASGKPVSPATDIYALGAVAYHCLAGTPPFPGETALEIALRHVSDEPPPLPAELPATARALVSRALTKDPAGRFPSAAAFAAAARKVAARLSAGGAGAATSKLTTRKLAAATGAAGVNPSGAAAGAGADSEVGADTAVDAADAANVTAPADGDPAPALVVAGDPVAPLRPAWRRRTGVLAGAGAILLIGLTGLALALSAGQPGSGTPAHSPTSSPGPVGPAAAPVASANPTKHPADVGWSSPASAGATSAAVPTGSGSAGAPQPSVTPTATNTPVAPPESPTGQPTGENTPTATSTAGDDPPQ